MDESKAKKLIEYLQTHAELTLFKQEEELIEQGRNLRHRFTIVLFINFLTILLFVSGLLLFIARSVLPLNSISEFIILFTLVYAVINCIASVLQAATKHQKLIKDIGLIEKNHQERIEKLDKERLEKEKTAPTNEKLVN